jgi:Tfp pilus assembly protein PilO
MLDYLKGKVTLRDWAFVGAILAVAVVLCLAFYFAVYTKETAKLTTINVELEKIRAELKVAYDTKKNFEQLEKDWEKADRLVALFENRLPEERDIRRLVSNFEGLGDTLGIQVELTQLPTLSDVSKETIPYKVTARGNFHQIASFINLLERDDRYLKISDLDIGEEEASVSEATFTLSTFRFLGSTARPEAKTNEPAK